MRPLIPLLFFLLAAACGGPAAPADAPASPGSITPGVDGVASAAPDMAPWAGPPLATDRVPEVHLTEWRRAANRTTCAPLAPVEVPRQAEATARAATFSGGWGVAYDLPELRSAFGVAGTGSRAGEPAYDEWPHRLTWADGSAAGYGPEGGTGPTQLAYLRITGEECLYNVWSRLGVEHLEALLHGLRRVDLP